MALRGRYPEFVYEAFHHEWTDGGLRLWFDFRMGDVVFHPESLVEERPFLHRDMPEALLDRLVFDIGMIELISYWKCACPPVVRVLCGALDAQQVAFWKKLYWNGLGEFYYTNGLVAGNLPRPLCEGENGGNREEKPDMENFMTIVSDSSLCQPAFPDERGGGESSYLVPIGGGKDSVVTLELLRRAGMSIRPLIMNPRGATAECARVAGFPLDEVLVIRRRIDPALLDLNARGYLNGHTPFSAMLAFYTRLASALTGIPNVALSNENSANESTVRGSYVNHQYSKSLEFENDFRNYTHSSFNYFSFLRPLSELQIAMLFSRFTAYHEVFRSCNVGSKQDIWCGHCAKCLFAYIILSPFIVPERLNSIFGKSMLDDETLRPEFDQLRGVAETKPFECVGTVGEVNQALAMTLRRWYPGERPALLRGLQAEAMEKMQSSAPISSLQTISPQGNLSPEEFQILQAACTESNN